MKEINFNGMIEPSVTCKKCLYKEQIETLKAKLEIATDELKRILQCEIISEERYGHARSIGKALADIGEVK
jgi:hypothetical protein